jgi:SAM-dependent methyltransferase
MAKANTGGCKTCDVARDGARELAIDPLHALRASYDAVAEEYVRRIGRELEGKPFDRALLDRFADRLAGPGPVWDLGCGPGHVTRYLRDRGVTIAGLDLSPALVASARRLDPAIPFEQGDFRRLAAPDHAWAGIVALYSIIHLPRPEVIPTLAEWSRAVKPGGLLLLAAHLGEDVRHLDEWWGHRVDVDFTFFQTPELVGYLEAGGWRVEEATERDPYPDVEAQTRRVYILAQVRAAG